MASDKFYDISVPLGAGSIDYPGDTPYRREVITRLQEGHDFELAGLHMSAHAGSHLDTPSHFIAGGKNLDDYKPHDFIRPVQVVAIQDPQVVHPSELTEVHTRPGEALLFKTTNSSSGLCRTGSYSETFVHLTPEAAAWCVDKELGIVGLDYITIEQHGAPGSPVHHSLLGAGILILEGIDLDQVPPGSYQLYCFPLRITGGEASPVRALLGPPKPTPPE